ncbi:MAG: YdeI/OmpD-associated family protein [Candidatus Eisenbacteria bacterium]
MVRQEVKQLYVTGREEWRAWLKKNHDTVKKIWLIYYKKHTGKPRIPYDDAVEEALCFGWIDSTVKRLDDERYMQKYTPRKAKSVWSETNKARAKKMIQQGRMTETGLSRIRDAKRSGEWKKAGSRDLPDEIPHDLKRALAANKSAKRNFENLAPSYKKQFIWWISSAKRDETRQKRIEKTVSMAEENKKPGML